jgi:disulfide bond formation protein DsbB
MKSPKFWLIATALACFALLAGAVYFQYTYYMYPCPWCVIQRYVFAAIGLICLVAAFLPQTMTRRSAMLGALFSVICICVGSAVYFPYANFMTSCPWCVIQRYVFAVIGLICLIAAFLPQSIARRFATLGALFSLFGISAAGWLIWVQAHPEVSCGIDPVETSLNKFPTAKLLPFLFKANGMCTTEYDPIMGLHMPQWSLLAFIGILIVLGSLALRRSR